MSVNRVSCFGFVLLFQNQKKKNRDAAGLGESSRTSTTLGKFLLMVCKSILQSLLCGNDGINAISAALRYS